MLEVVPGQHAQEVGRYQDLTVTILSGPNPDGGYGNALGQFPGNGSGDELQNDAKCIGFDQGIGIGEKALVFGFMTALNMVTALFEDVLGQHAEVA